MVKRLMIAAHGADEFIGEVFGCYFVCAVGDLCREDGDDFFATPGEIGLGRKVGLSRYGQVFWCRFAARVLVRFPQRVSPRRIEFASQRNDFRVRCFSHKTTLRSVSSGLD